MLAAISRRDAHGARRSRVTTPNTDACARAREETEKKGRDGDDDAGPHENTHRFARGRARAAQNARPPRRVLVRERHSPRSARRVRMRGRCGWDRQRRPHGKSAEIAPPNAGPAQPTARKTVPPTESGHVAAPPGGVHESVESVA